MFFGLSFKPGKDSYTHIPVNLVVNKILQSYPNVNGDRLDNMAQQEPRQPLAVRARDGICHIDQSAATRLMAER
jgi:hypothetical protein